MFLSVLGCLCTARTIYDVTCIPKVFIQMYLGIGKKLNMSFHTVWFRLSESRNHRSSYYLPPHSSCNRLHEGIILVRDWSYPCRQLRLSEMNFVACSKWLPVDISRGKTKIITAWKLKKVRITFIRTRNVFQKWLGIHWVPTRNSVYAKSPPDLKSGSEGHRERDCIYNPKTLYDVYARSTWN